MQRDEFREWLKRKPFQPFRVHVADGRTYEVHYRRMNLLAATFVKIGIPMPGSTNPIVCDHTEYVRLTEIVRVELLDNASSVATTEGN